MINLNNLFDMGSLKKEINHWLEEIKNDFDQYKIDRDTAEVQVETVANGQRGRYQPDLIANFFGEENLGYERNVNSDNIENQDKWFHQDSRNELFDKISDDEFVWDNIDDYAGKVAKELNKKINIPGVNLYFGNLESDGSWGLMMSVDKDALKENVLNTMDESFREGTASHFNSLLEKWAKKYNVKFEWKFKEVKKKTESYFVLDLNYDEYIKLPQEAKTELNGLTRQFHVDFTYKNKNWTPVIENKSPVKECLDMLLKEEKEIIAPKNSYLVKTKTGLLILPNFDKVKKKNIYFDGQKWVFQSKKKVFHGKPFPVELFFFDGKKYFLVGKDGKKDKQISDTDQKIVNDLLKDKTKVHSVDIKH